MKHNGSFSSAMEGLAIQSLVRSYRLHRALLCKGLMVLLVVQGTNSCTESALIMGLQLPRKEKRKHWFRWLFLWLFVCLLRCWSNSQLPVILVAIPMASPMAVCSWSVDLPLSYQLFLWLFLWLLWCWPIFQLPPSPMVTL